MNILLWVLQGFLAFYFLSGGFYSLKNFDKLSKAVAYMKALPKSFWTLNSVLQILFAIGLILPPLIGVAPQACAVSAAGLAVLMFFASGLQAMYGGFPANLWSLLPGLVAAFVAYGRFSLSPF